LRQFKTKFLPVVRRATPHAFRELETLGP
jgi:hypothetical protein